jgi:MoaA/NifB/PqqE/SkfB family radical SAM enzyme
MSDSAKNSLSRTVAQAGFIFSNARNVSNVLLNRVLHRPPACIPIGLLFVTNRCNLRCKMCGVCEHENMRHDNELTTDEWKQVILSLKKMRCALISSSGGEPLLRDDFYDIIRFAREQNIAFHMCTNGILLNRDRVLRLRDSGVNTVSISVESPDPAIHEQLRGKGTFEKTIAGIRRLRELAPEIHVGINYLITAINYHDMDRMIPFAEELDVHQLKFAPIHTNLLHRRKDLDYYRELIFTGEMIEELNTEIQKLLAATRKTRLTTTSPMFLSKISQFYRNPPSFKCYAGYAAVAIEPTGKVAPCVDMDGDWSVRDKPLEEIWRSPEFQRQRQCVHKCASTCWDTTNAELSIRLRLRSLLGNLALTWKDIRFYYSSEDKS